MSPIPNRKNDQARRKSPRESSDTESEACVDDEECARTESTSDDGLRMSDSLEELHGELRKLRLGAGQPSLRLIAKETGWSRATTGRVFNGDFVPKWDPLEAVVAYLGGSTERFRQLWIDCMDGAAARILAATTEHHDDTPPSTSKVAVTVDTTVTATTATAQPRATRHAPPQARRARYDCGAHPGCNHCDDSLVHRQPS